MLIVFNIESLSMHRIKENMPNVISQAFSWLALLVSAHEISQATEDNMFLK